MGVDAKFYVRPEIGPEEIMTALKTLGKKNVRYENTKVAPGYLNIFFDSEKGDHQRMIHFHYNMNDSYFGMNCNLMSLRSNDESIEVFTALAKIFGGILQEEDTTDHCEMFQVPGAGNVRWLLEQYFARHPQVPQDSDEQVKQFAEWTKIDF